jgi:phage FluMu gp28-like protein
VHETSLLLDLANGSRIVSLPGKEETVRGYSGVTLLIIDEAARVPDELYYATRPMLAVSSGRLICLSTPFGKRGFFFQEWTEGKNWQRITITADECPRITADFLEEERRALGPHWFAQEYMCEFLESSHQVFSHDLIASALDEDISPLFPDRKSA